MNLLKNPARRLAKALLAIGFMSLMATTSVFGQFVFYEFPSGPPGSSIIGPDPSGGITNSLVLIYFLPVGVMPGDVLLTEPSPSGQTNTQPPSDIIRFWNPTGSSNQTEVIFYSERPDPNDPFELPVPADVGLPAQLQPLIAGPYTEFGDEFFNGYLYVALPGMPGSTPFGTVQYQIISDVPEPSTFMLAGLGGGLMLLLRWGWARRK